MTPHSLIRWDADAIAAWDSAPSESRCASFDAQTGRAGSLVTDPLVLAEPAEAVQARVLLCAEPGAALPELEPFALCLTAREAGMATGAQASGQLCACWQRASSGVAYLIHPQGWWAPRPGDGSAWA